MITLLVKEAETLGDKSIGLLSAKKPYALMLRTRFGIHTFGMKFAIDVVVLDQKGRVVGMKENLLPNRFHFWNPSYDTIVELPTGTIAVKKIDVGQKIRIQKVR